MNELLQTPNRRRMTRRELLLGGSACVALGLAACGNSEEDPASQTPATETTPTKEVEHCPIVGKEDLYEDDVDCIIEPQSN